MPQRSDAALAGLNPPSLSVDPCCGSIRQTDETKPMTSSQKYAVPALVPPVGKPYLMRVVVVMGGGQVVTVKSDINEPVHPNQP